jgi:signal transduction histidine kinase
LEKLPAFVIGGHSASARMENLIDNATKFTEQGGAPWSQTDQRPGDKIGVAFAISDSGIGLTLKEITLFKSLSQASVNIAARFGGAGLGLSSSQARAMGAISSSRHGAALEPRSY